MASEKEVTFVRDLKLTHFSINADTFIDKHGHIQNLGMCFSTPVLPQKETNENQKKNPG